MMALSSLCLLALASVGTLSHVGHGQETCVVDASGFGCEEDGGNDMLLLQLGTSRRGAGAVEGQTVTSDVPGAEAVGDSDIMQVESRCMNMIAAQSATKHQVRACLPGEVSQNASLRQAGLAHPNECLMDMMPQIYAKMCQLCSVSALDGVVSVSHDRGTGACAMRYNALNRINDALNNGNNVAHQITLATTEITNLMQRFPNSFNEHAGTAADSALSGSRSLADLDGNGHVSAAEMEAHLQAVYIVVDMANFAVLPGQLTASQLDGWTSERMGRWVNFGGVFAASSLLETGAVDQEGLIPGSQPVGSSTIFQVEARCASMIAASSPATPPVQCPAGEVTQNAALRALGLANPNQCLIDNLAGVYTKMCQLCSQSMLDGVVSVSHNRGSGACAMRYNSLNRISAALTAGDDVAAQLTLATNQITSLMARYPTITNQTAFDAEAAMPAASRSLADTDGNGHLSQAELVAYFQAVYIITDMMNYAILPGDLTPTQLDAFTSDAMGSWVQFNTAGRSAPVVHNLAHQHQGA